MYRVIYPFKDREDKHIYDIKGERFPFDGREISEERIIELSTANNKIGRVLIKKEKEYSEMTVKELLKRCKKMGIETTNDMLKEELISLLQAKMSE